MAVSIFFVSLQYVKILRIKYIKTLLFTTLTCILFASCASMVKLKDPVVTKNESLSNYKYVYVTPTPERTSSSAAIYGNQYGSYGGAETKSLIPSDIISGFMLKKGFVRLPQLDPDLLDQTLIINYGESGRRNVTWGYTLEVTIQMLSARTNSIVCTCSAEGLGNTESDDLRIAINRALEEAFK